ncbi:MAG: DUF3298 domain-containing protein [Candidatus Colwellbacteria bacterium]|nr:DUF3298 domain-containing protein [Candidatus Colwellbacteria bacterium]
MKNKWIITAILVIAASGAGIFWLGYKNEDEIKPPAISDYSVSEKSVEEMTDFYRITAKYPIDPLDKDGAIKEFIDYQVNQRKEDWKTGGEIHNQEKELEERFPDRPKMVYSMDIIYEKYVSEKMGTVSYVFTIGEYTGGANANARVQSFSLNQEGQIFIEDILDLANNYNDVNLSKTLLDKALSDSERFPVADIVEEGLGLAFLKDDDITFDQKKCSCDGFLFASNFQNFAITDDGIIFFFGKYQITIGASGVVDIVLSWSELAPYLK